MCCLNGVVSFVDFCSRSNLNWTALTAPQLPDAPVVGWWAEPVWNDEPEELAWAAWTSEIASGLRASRTLLKLNHILIDSVEMFINFSSSLLTTLATVHLLGARTALRTMFERFGKPDADDSCSGACKAGWLQPMSVRAALVRNEGPLHLPEGG